MWQDALFALHTVDNNRTGSDIKINRIVCNIQQGVKYHNTASLQKVKSWFCYLNITKITIQKLK